MQHGLRGRLLASTSRTANTALTQAQFGHFALDVEGLAVGRAQYSMQFDHYEQVPQAIADEVKAKYA